MSDGAKAYRPSGRWWRGLVNVAMVAGFLTAVSFLPPDTSLKEVQRSGILRVCVPDNSPPFVTGDKDKPGYDIEMLGEVAKDLGVRLVLNANSRIGRDFNPLNWRVTRAQCSVIAGGVSDSTAMRGFMQMLPNGVATGWMYISLEDRFPQDISSAAVFPGSAGLDRIQLSQFLRMHNIHIQLVKSPGEMRAALQQRAVQAGISDAFVVQMIQAQLPEMTVDWLPDPPFERRELAYGLWKGDATLFRAMRDSIARIREDGRAVSIAKRYEIYLEASEATE